MSKENFETTEQAAWDLQQEIWYDLYMTFNDDNYRHCDNAFFNQHYETSNDIKLGNISFIEEIMGFGISFEKIVSAVPAAKQFAEKFS